jgi:hypothetical protein
VLILPWRAGLHYKEEATPGVYTIATIPVGDVANSSTVRIPPTPISFAYAPPHVHQSLTIVAWGNDQFLRSQPVADDVELTLEVRSHAIFGDADAVELGRMTVAYAFPVDRRCEQTCASQLYKAVA